MSVHWEKVLTDPLGLAGYVLFLVFGVVTLIAKRRTALHRWVVPAGFTMAAVLLLSCLYLAYHRKSPPTPVLPTTQSPQAASMHINKVDQKVENGNAVAGVQGSVTITSVPAASRTPTKQQNSKPKH